MYIFTGKKRGKNNKKRGKTNRLRAAHKAKQRRRQNRMHGRRLSAKL